MRIDKLQIELRPRSNAQALDLGYTLLRSHAGAAYMAFIVLWLPLLALSAALTIWLPEYGWAWLFLPWWFKPLLERAPLYVLSRQVFGTTVTWQEAVRAWPHQLGGGWFRLLTWGRLFSAGRGLSHPVWQLEGARGRVASVRRSMLGNNGTASSAFWFGTVCAHLEVVLQVGALGFIGIFLGEGKLSNPFVLYANMGDDGGGTLVQLLGLAAFGLSAALMAPIYTACCFTLYLNRRASMEAWDIELQLRQMKRPPAARARGGAPVLGMAMAMAGALLTLSLAGAPPAQAADAPPPANLDKCEPKETQTSERGPLLSPEQDKVRKQVDQLYLGDDLRGYNCVEQWHPKVKPAEKEKEKAKKTDPATVNLLNQLATILKVIVIALAIGLVAWVLYRYRHRFPSFARGGGKARVATEIGGLNIRAESLPEDVTAAVRALWAQGKQRAALALLYRATLSRLVTEDALALRQGNTEGDCLRLARQARQHQRLSEGRLDVAIATTTLWLNGAYGARWPADTTVLAVCADWDAQFGNAKGSPA